jgi:omega-6 fatty acid desaturase (delta-12 desaturase)
LDLSPAPLPDARTLAEVLERYRTPSFGRSLSQLAVSAVLFALAWTASLLALHVGVWLTIILSAVAALFLMRLFMIQHDCGHGSFFRSQRLNDAVGGVIGVLTLVPYRYWRRTHAIHHKTSGNLTNRTFGDIDLKTVREYQSLSRFGRLKYRLYRHPFVLLGIGPIYQFIFKHRLPLDIPFAWRREWTSVLMTNLGLLLIVVVAWSTIGLRNFLLVQIPISVFAGAIGVFLFYVQHQFEDTYWREHPEWEFHAAGMKGSSHLVLPKPLQWLTANIGFHHIHHVNSRIPNYRLPDCHYEQAMARHVTPITLWDGVKCLRLALWDEDARRLVSFRQARVAATS